MVYHEHIKFAMTGLAPPIIPPSLVYPFHIYSKTVLGQRNLSDSFRGGLFTAPTVFERYYVNNSLVRRVRLVLGLATYRES